MDHPRSINNVDENVGIPEDLRCKRTDGKQWRCNALSMPDKTVCEKHYIQAKKRAANSALRASLKKAKTRSISESNYLDSKNYETDFSLMGAKDEDGLAAAPSKKRREKLPKRRASYSPETMSVRSMCRTPQKSVDDSPRDTSLFDENRTRSFSRTPPSPVDSARNRILRNSNGFGLREHSSRSTDSSDDAEEQTCHQCQRSDRDIIIWCMRCDVRGYCESCISKWYPDIPLDEMQKACPVCRAICNCRLCLNGDIMIKLRVQEMTVLDKLQYLHRLLSLVHPVLKKIHSVQSFELEVEAKVHGAKTDIPRASVRPDEQMCCDCCKVPIIDYHRHCAICLYDLCLTCCRDLRLASLAVAEGKPDKHQVVHTDQDVDMSADKTTEAVGGNEHVVDPKHRLYLSHRFLNWKANNDGSIPCPPKESNGCGCPSLDLRRIYKMNWVAKFVKNAEELVSGCKVHHVNSFQTYLSCVGRVGSQSRGLNDSNLAQFSHNEDSSNNFLYSIVSQDLKHEGFFHFQKHWESGEPIIVKGVFDLTLTSMWDPMNIWSEIWETTDGTMRDEKRIVKAINCLDWSEVDIELGQFINGYSSGLVHENGWPEMLKLKDWPPRSALEGFLLYQRPEFISNLPLLEYIHSKYGILNLFSKLPPNSQQIDVGPKLYIASGTSEELVAGDPLTNLPIKMSDMVFLLMHTCEVKFKGGNLVKIGKTNQPFAEFDEKESRRDTHMLKFEMTSEEGDKSIGLSLNEDIENGYSLELNVKEDIMEGQMHNGKEICSTEEDLRDGYNTVKESWESVPGGAQAGAIWDVFRQQDVPKLKEYLRVHLSEFRNVEGLSDDSVTCGLFQQAVFLSKAHKRRLKDEFKIEPWTIEQHVGEAVFIPAGCPFQLKNLQSSVQLGLDFLSPESLAKSVHLAEEIRCLPNDHEAKLQMSEVGKMALYAASSAIREIRKLVLDPKVGADLGFEDPNLTAMVSENIEKLKKPKPISCI